MKRTLDFNILSYIVVLPLCAFDGEEYRYYYGGEQVKTVNNRFYAAKSDKTRVGRAMLRSAMDGEMRLGRGTLLIMETDGTYTLVYLYDYAGSPIGMKYRTTEYPEGTWETYWYEKNLQGDVVAVYSDTGVKMLSYHYDAWGKMSVTYLNGSFPIDPVGKNPFTYRGYYYDSDLRMYNLQTRYYDPAIKRFLTPDEIYYLGANGDLSSFNLYSYCSNNPVMYADPSGHFAISTLIIGAIIGTVIGGATSVISQGLTKGWDDINGWQVLLDATIGGISGALGASGINHVVSMVAGGVLGAAGSIGGDLIASGGDWSHVDVGKAILMGAIGVGLGKWTGAGTQNSKTMVSTINAGKSWGSKAFLTSAKEALLRPNSGLTLQTMYMNMSKAIILYTVQGITKVSAATLGSTILGNTIGW